MEKYLLGAADPSLLPAGAGLGMASIDFDSRSMEISTVGCAPTLRQSLPRPAAQWDPTPGSAHRISSVSPLSLLCMEDA